MSYSEIHHETIRAALTPLTKEHYDGADMRLRHGKGLDEEFIEAMAQMPDSIGDGISTFRPDYVSLNYELSGSVRKLATQSLVRSESFVVPVTMKPQQVEDMMYGRPIEKEFYGAVTITEPKWPRRRIEKTVHYFIRRNPALLIPVAADGLDAYLNGGLMVPSEAEELKDKINETQRTVMVIRRVENETVQKFIDSFAPNEGAL